MQQRLEAFLGLSVSLTGFSRLHLVGTGVADEYLGTLDRIVPGEIVELLLQVHAGVENGADTPTAILADAKLGPVARNIIVLWYTGTWVPLPDEWCATFGRAADDVAQVVSAESYLAGLQWSAIGAHPPGGLPPGFASWANSPQGV